MEVHLFWTSKLVSSRLCARWEIRSNCEDVFLLGAMVLAENLNRLLTGSESCRQGR